MLTATVDRAGPRPAQGSMRRHLGAVLAGNALHEAVADVLTAGLPCDLRCRGAALAAVQDLATATIDAVGQVLDRQLFQRRRQGGKVALPAAPDSEAEELAEAEAAARRLLFGTYHRALAKEEDPASAFILALERSQEGAIKKPGALLVAHRWGLLAEDPAARRDFAAWFPKTEQTCKGE